MNENKGSFKQELKDGYDPMSVRRLHVETDGGQSLDMDLSPLQLATAFLALGIEITPKGWTGFPDEQLKAEIMPSLEDGGAEAKGYGYGYAEGYRQCLADVMRDGVKSATKIAYSKDLRRTAEQAHATQVSLATDPGKFGNPRKTVYIEAPGTVAVKPYKPV